MAAKKGSLFVIFLTVFIDLLGFGMVLPLLPIYAQSFVHDKTGAVIGMLMASFSAMQFLFAPVWGRLSDRIGRRPVLMIGLTGSVVFYTLFGLATVWQDIVLLFVARIGAGIAGATIPTAQAYIADTTTLEGRTKGMALIGMAFGLGFTLGPLLGLVAIDEQASEKTLAAALSPSETAATTTPPPVAVERPSPGPGYVAAGLSAVALLLAIFLLPESLAPGSASAAKKLLDTRALADALSIPSIGALLAAYFICILAFGNFETTLSMMIKGKASGSPFHFTYHEVFYTFAYIGLVLTIAQGLLVRRLSGKVPEGIMAAFGAVLEVIGFGLMMMAIDSGKRGHLYGALTVVVCGFAMMMPTLMSLISRRSDPAKQGGILGLGQSISALARIFGPLIGLPLLELNIKLPYEVGAGMMAVGLAAIFFAARRGHDYGAAPEAVEPMMEM